MADRNMPEGISLTSPEQDYDDSKELIEVAWSQAPLLHHHTTICDLLHTR